MAGRVNFDPTFEKNTQKHVFCFRVRKLRGGWTNFDPNFRISKVGVVVGQIFITIILDGFLGGVHGCQENFRA